MTSRGRRRLDEMQVDTAMAAVRSDASRDVIADIKTGATNEYQRVKRHKQSELNYRRTAGCAAAGPPSRVQKKKVDNHASAVASRCKQEFLVLQFEILLRRKLTEAQILSAACVESRSALSEKMAIICSKDAEIAKLRKQLAAYQAHAAPPSAAVSSARSSAPSAAPLPSHVPMSISMPQPPFGRAVMPHFSGPIALPPLPTAQVAAAPKFAIVKSEELHAAFPNAHVMASTPLPVPPVLTHSHLSLTEHGTLDGQDVGAAMDEIISPVSTLDGLQQPLSTDDAIMSALAGHKNGVSSQLWRPRMPTDDLVKADSTNSRMHPAA